MDLEMVLNGDDGESVPLSPSLLSSVLWGQQFFFSPVCFPDGGSNWSSHEGFNVYPLLLDLYKRGHNLSSTFHINHHI